MNSVFVDTGAFIALAGTRDRHYDRANVIYAELLSTRTRLVTTNHILDETCTWLLREQMAGHRAAVEMAEFVLGSYSPFTLRDSGMSSLPSANAVLIFSSPLIEQEAARIFAKYDTAGFSFTDCVSFAVMQALGMKQVFSFDQHYDMMGFERLQA
ncbi:MAG: PIN domain-containing protein [Armatimonadetes bacterium]|nr:PIN domain-containing protein [Armatimonadota bacterium]